MSMGGGVTGLGPSSKNANLFPPSLMIKYQYHHKRPKAPNNSNFAQILTFATDGAHLGSGLPAVVVISWVPQQLHSEPHFATFVEGY